VGFLALVWAPSLAWGLTELEEESELSTRYETPHTPWARPYARGKLRILFFMDIGYCGTVPREVVELKQRFDLDAEAVFWANIIDSPKYHWHGDAAGLARMEHLVAQPWDCFVFFGLPVEQVPVREQYRLLSAVTQGAGLVLVGTEDPRVLKPERQFAELPGFLATGVPLAALPFVTDGVLKDVSAGQRTDAAAAARLLAAYRVRDGRGVRLPARPVLDGDDPTWQTQYEYWQSLFGRAILWAANREPTVDLRVQAVAAVVERVGLPAEAGVTVAWAGAAGAKGFRLEASLRRLDAGPTTDALALGVGSEGGLAIGMPKVRAGQYFVDVRATSRGGVEAWATAAVEVTSPLRVAAVALDRSYGEVGESLAGTVSLEGLPTPADGLAARVSLRDATGRELVRQEFPAAGAVAFRFVIAAWMPMLVRVEAVVLENGQEVAAGSALFSVTQRRRGEFNVLVWDVPRGTLGPYGEESLRRLGMTLHLNQGNPPHYVAGGNVAWVPYTTHIGQACSPTCWNDEQGVQEYVDKIVAPYGPSRQNGVFVYSLGDEIITRGACTRPTCLSAYRKYLQGEYGTLDALNASWGSAYASFDEVQLSAPDDNQEAEARRLGSYPRWYDRQAFQSYNFTRLCQRFVDRFSQLDPQARVGFEGAGAFEAGDDYDLIVRTNGFWSPYPGLGDDIIRSIAPRDFPRSNWMGYTKDADTLLSKYWRMVCRGCDSVWWWRWDGISTFHGLLAPDLGPYRATAELARDTQVVRDGLGTLLLRSEMLDDGIAVLYSVPSAYACQVEAGPSYGRYAPAHEDWSRVIRGAGLQYRYVTDRMLRLGEFRRDRYRVLLLARTEAIGATEAAAIRDFAEAGGTVIADLRPGVYDGHCKPLDKGALDDLFGVERVGRPEASMERASVSMVPSGAAVTLEWDKAGSDAGVRISTGEALGQCGTAPLAIVRKVGKGQAVLLNFAVGSFMAAGSGAAAAGPREFLGHLFARAGVRPAIDVRDADGRPAANLEVVRWRNGGTDLVVLFREAGQREEVTLTFPEARHVYDLRQRRHLGREGSVRADLIPCRATFFALTPTRAEPVDLALTAGRATRGGVARATLACPGADGIRAVRIRVQTPDETDAEPFRRVVMVGPEGTTVDLPIAHNDPAGRWRVTATELFTDQATTARLRVR